LSCPSGKLFGLDDGHDVFFMHDQELLAFDLHFRAAEFAEQDLVSDLDVAGPYLVVVENPAVTDRYDPALSGLVTCRIRNDDAAAGRRDPLPGVSR
jgi:hypothetical protein